MLKGILKSKLRKDTEIQAIKHAGKKKSSLHGFLKSSLHGFQKSSLHGF